MNADDWIKVIDHTVFVVVCLVFVLGMLGAFDKR